MLDLSKSHSIAKIWQRQILGHYRVGGQTYFNKIQAIEMATKLGTNPTWHFYDDEFGAYNWRQEPPMSLRDAYRMRAQQLREKYDYLILFYSGGIDSHTVLTTFLQNDIKIDSVVIFGTYDFDSDKTSKFNLEQYRVAIPFAQQYQDRYDLKILDISPYFKTLNHQDWFYDSGNALYPSTMIQAMIHRDPYIQQWINRGSTAIIRGVDKPGVFFDLGRFYCVFSDSVLPPIAQESTELYEFFYWSPDCPWLIAKQAHVIKNYFKKHPELCDQLTTCNNQDIIDRYIVPLIYDVGVTPGHRPNYFSVGKSPRSQIFSHRETFFFDSAPELTCQSQWKKGLQYLDRILSPNFKSGGTLYQGVAPTRSARYDLGS
jgi:hypothetical protein